MTHAPREPVPLWKGPQFTFYTFDTTGLNLTLPMIFTENIPIKSLKIQPNEPIPLRELTPNLHDDYQPLVDVLAPSAPPMDEWKANLDMAMQTPLGTSVQKSNPNSIYGELDEYFVINYDPFEYLIAQEGNLDDMKSHHPILAPNDYMKRNDSTLQRPLTPKPPAKPLEDEDLTLLENYKSPQENQNQEIISNTKEDSKKKEEQKEGDEPKTNIFSSLFNSISSATAKLTNSQKDIGKNSLLIDDDYDGDTNKKEKDKLHQNLEENYSTKPQFIFLDNNKAKNAEDTAEGRNSKLSVNLNNNNVGTSVNLNELTKDNYYR